MLSHSSAFNDSQRGVFMTNLRSFAVEMMRVATVLSVGHAVQIAVSYDLVLSKDRPANAVNVATNTERTRQFVQQVLRPEGILPRPRALYY